MTGLTPTIGKGKHGVVPGAAIAALTSACELHRQG